MSRRRGSRFATRRPIPIAAKRTAMLARDRLELFTTTDGGWSDGGWLAESQSSQTQLREDLTRAGNAADDTLAANALDDALARLASVAAQVRSSVETHQIAANRERSMTLILISIFSGAFILLATGIGVLHYRSVTHPVDRLAAAVRQFATGHLDGRVSNHGDREFAQLANDLNRMADELQTLVSGPGTKSG